MFDEEQMMRDSSTWGPVTREIIDEAKRICENACRLAGYGPRRTKSEVSQFWPDFLDMARQNLIANK